jgi:hypothetical protein
MDLLKAIQELHKERKRLDGVIAALERTLNDKGVAPEGKVPQRRGRKSMSREERQKVSERMRKYWAARRKKAAVKARD